MGFLKNLIYGDPDTDGMIYRIRVFDNGHHIKTATVAARGQERINLVVKPKEYFFLGEEVKLAFIIDPKIRPHYFGRIMEIDFDVRDSTQLADLFTLVPDLVQQVNENYYNILKAIKDENDKNNSTIDAEFTDKTDQGLSESIMALTDPVNDPVPEVLPEKTAIEKKLEKIPGVVRTSHAIETIAKSLSNVATDMKGLQLLYEISSEKKDEKKQELIQKTLDFCQKPGNEKCLRWLPQRLKIEPEISAIVSQTELDGVGILPEYYIKQSTAEISEKMLARPKQVDDWKTTAIWIIGIIAVLGLVIFLLLKGMGKV